MKITCIGTGYVGLTTGACLANLGHDVLCMDVDQQKLASIADGKIPFYEPGLQELVLENKKKGRLRFTTNSKEAIHFGEVIFNCVWTPNTKKGAADLQAVFTVTDNIAKFANGSKVLINKSTVPPGTAQQCHQIVKDSKEKITIVSNPEFLKQGNAIYDFNHPDKIVVGAKSPQAFQVLRRVYQGLLKTYIPFLETNWETSEMIKYANNSFLAMKISFINEIANICGLVDADVKMVSTAIGMDYRISPKFLNAGIGYGGSCFSKDVQALVKTAILKGYTPNLLKEVHLSNERQKKILLPKIINELEKIKGDTVTIWGLSFKPKTSDLRGAPSLQLIDGLLEKKIKVIVYDPVALEEAKKIYGHKITYSNILDDSVKGSNAIVLVTEWDEFRNVNFSDLAKSMKSKILFDGRNIYQPAQIKEFGFTYHGLGRR